MSGSIQGSSLANQGSSLTVSARAQARSSLEHFLGQSCPGHTCPLRCHRKPGSESCPGWRASSVLARHTRIKGRWTGLFTVRARPGTKRPLRGRRNGSEAPSDSIEGSWKPASGSSHCHTNNELNRKWSSCHEWRASIGHVSWAAGCEVRIPLSPRGHAQALAAIPPEWPAVSAANGALLFKAGAVVRLLLRQARRCCA